MHVEVIESWEALEPHRAVWQDLAGDHPFLQWSWLRRWWDAFGEHRNLLVLRITAEETTDRDDPKSTLAFAPFFREHNWVQGNVIRFLGSGRVCSDYLRILCRDDDQAAAAKAIGDWLRDHASHHQPPIRWNLLELDGVVGNEPTVETMVGELEQRGALLDDTTSLHVWRVELPESWEAFAKEKLKSQYRKKFRKLSKKWLETGQAKLCRAETPDQVQTMLDELIALHERRRTSIGEEGCFGDPRFVRWMHNICQDLFDSGHLRLSALDADERRVAMAVGFEFGGVLYHYQTGIETDALAMSPGFVLNIAIIQAAIQRGLHAIDFLRGDEHYKSMFGGVPSDCRRLRIVPPNTASLLRHRLWRAGGSVRKLMKGWR